MPNLKTIDTNFLYKDLPRDGKDPKRNMLVQNQGVGDVSSLVDAKRW